MLYFAIIMEIISRFYFDRLLPRDISEVPASHCRHPNRGFSKIFV